MYALISYLLTCFSHNVCSGAPSCSWLFGRLSALHLVMHVTQPKTCFGSQESCMHAVMRLSQR